jgi:hypothetical protein
MTAEIAPAPAAKPSPLTNGRALGIQQRLVEIGRIRMGDKGPKGEPRKLGHWRLTSASRPLLEAAARIYGGTVRAWQGAPDEGMWELLTTSDTLDVMVPPTINAYSQFFEEWSGGTCNLRCDGRWEQIAEKACDHGDHEGMKVTTRVSVILPKLPGLGVFRLETHGWNAAATLPSSLELIGAVGRWIPAVIRLENRSSSTRDPKTNRVLKRRFVVPVIDLIGASFADLLATGQASDAYQEPALGAGPGSLALPPGPSRPNPNRRVPRPELAPEPPLDDETAPLATPVDEPFPIEAPAPAATGAPTPAQALVEAAVVSGEAGEESLDMAVTIRAAAIASDLTGGLTPEQQAGLAKAFGTTPPAVTLAGLQVLWRDAIATGEGGKPRAELTAARGQAILLVAESLGDGFRHAWAQLVKSA